MKVRACLDSGRRSLLGKGVGLVSTMAMPGPTGLLVRPAAKSEEKKKPGEGHSEELSASEDLMREHGILNRILLVYEEIAARLRGGREFPPEVLAGGADIIRRFIEDYHEKLEENYLFPRFDKAG